MRGFTTAQRARVRECILTLRTLGMLHTAPSTSWTKKGELRISKAGSTFRKPRQFSTNYGK